jgi:hypothetical protein
MSEFVEYQHLLFFFEVAGEKPTNFILIKVRRDTDCRSTEGEREGESGY